MQVDFRSILVDVVDGVKWVHFHFSGGERIRREEDNPVLYKRDRYFTSLKDIAGFDDLPDLSICREFTSRGQVACRDKFKNTVGILIRGYRQPRGPVSPVPEFPEVQL